MVTADSVKSKIRGLIDKSNAKTGHIDKDLTAAVDTLIAGYGEDGTALPEIDPSILGTSNDLVSGKQLIDSSGGIVTGAIPETSVGLDFKESSVHFVSSVNDIRLVNTIDEDILMRSGSKVYVNAEATEFGDASAADVAAGKTFTSAAGHKVVGTMSPGGDFTVTDDGAGNVTITSSAITDNNGNVVIA